MQSAHIYNHRIASHRIASLHALSQRYIVEESIASKEPLVSQQHTILLAYLSTRDTWTCFHAVCRRKALLLLIQRHYFVAIHLDPKHAIIWW